MPPQRENILRAEGYISRYLRDIRRQELGMTLSELLLEWLEVRGFRFRRRVGGVTKIVIYRPKSGTWGRVELVVYDRGMAPEVDYNNTFNLLRFGRDGRLDWSCFLDIRDPKSLEVLEAAIVDGSMIDGAHIA